MARRTSVEHLARRRAREVIAALSLATALLSIAAAAAPAFAKGSYPAGDSSLVSYYASIEAAKLGVSLPGGAAKFIKLRESPQHLVVETAPDGTKSESLAVTDCRDAADEALGAAVGCTITIARDAHANGAGELRDAISHEVFHCFQAAMSGTLANFNRPGNSWLVEGSAAWVGAEFAPSSALPRGWWKTYLTSPHVSLLARTYTAIGFFGHMASSGLSPWRRFPAMFAATTNGAAYTAAIGSGKPFLDSEASVFFREPAFGSDWDATGTDVPSAGEVGFTPSKVDIASKDRLLSAAPYADGAYLISTKKMPPSMPVLEVQVSADHLRLHSLGGGDVNEVDPGDLRLCTDAKGCDCPGQPPVDFKQFSRGDLAISGGPSGGSVSLIPRKRCEPLLAPRTCEGLLPGYTLPLAATLERASGQKLAVETSDPASGYHSSVCLFAGAKGEQVENAEMESVFDGVTAVDSYVKRFGTVAAAEREFALPPAFPGQGSPPTFVPGVGDEAAVSTLAATNAKGEPEYAGQASVRVRNVIAGFSILSTGGNDEASNGGTLALLAQVAAEF